MVVIHIWYCLEEYYTSCTITPQRTLEALYKRLWFPSSKSTSFWNGALVNVLSLWKKAEEKKWKQRNWVLAVCECNARGLYFQEKLMTLYNGQWYWNYFYWFNCCPHFILYCYPTPPHSTYLLTMIHLCTCTQALLYFYVINLSARKIWNRIHSFTELQ